MLRGLRAGTEYLVTVTAQYANSIGESVSGRARTRECPCHRDGGAGRRWVPTACGAGGSSLAPSALREPGWLRAGFPCGGDWTDLPAAGLAAWPRAPPRATASATPCKVRVLSLRADGPVWMPYLCTAPWAGQDMAGCMLGEGGCMHGGDAGGACQKRCGCVHACPHRGGRRSCAGCGARVPTEAWRRRVCSYARRL